MRTLLLLLAGLFCARPAVAALQRMEVGGEIRIRMRANVNYQPTAGAPARMPYAEGAIWGRPLGPKGIASRYLFDDNGEDRYYGEMQTRLHTTAHFSDGVRSAVEFETSENWGIAFRSDPITGIDGAGAGNVSLLQAYIEVDELFGLPVRARAGRQTMEFGKGWLVGDQTSGVRALAFDALRLTYSQGSLTVDAWWSKLDEVQRGDVDVDFYGVYGAWTNDTRANIAAYWMLVRDGAAVHDTSLGPAGEWLESLWGVDDYGATTLHTAGTRLWGAWGSLDYDWELAYQFGAAGPIGAGFAPAGGGYGDDDAHFGNIGTDLEVGYTFHALWTPRVYLGGAWYEGHDNRQASVLERLNPFHQGRASLSFNRLFSDASAKYFLILDGGQTLSNFRALRWGVEFRPVERLEIKAEVEQFWVDQPFDRPVTPLPLLSFLTEESSRNLGLQLQLIARYFITPDLWFRVWAEHFFPGAGIPDGSYSDQNGLAYLQGSGREHANYLEATVGIRF